MYPQAERGIGCSILKQHFPFVEDEEAMRIRLRKTRVAVTAGACGIGLRLTLSSQAPEMNLWAWRARYRKKFRACSLRDLNEKKELLPRLPSCLPLSITLSLVYFDFLEPDVPPFPPPTQLLPRHFFSLLLLLSFLFYFFPFFASFGVPFVTRTSFPWKDCATGSKNLMKYLSRFIATCCDIKRRGNIKYFTQRNNKKKKI